MSKPMTIQNMCEVGDIPMVIGYHPNYSTLCTIGKRPFYGHLDIEYIPKSVLLEFEAFEDWLHTLALRDFTVESLCQKIFDVLRGELQDPVYLKVEVHADTTVHAPVSATLELGAIRG